MRYVRLRSEHDHQKTKIPVCPHCGAELDNMAQDIIGSLMAGMRIMPHSACCIACGKPLTVSVNFAVTFDTAA